MIFVIEDDLSFAKCLELYLKPEKVKIFSNIIDATAALDDELPSLIFLDVLLTGPDGFTLLNELISYPDTRKIPIIIVSSLDFSGKDLSDYGVVATLNKDVLTPKEIKSYAKRYSR